VAINHLVQGCFTGGITGRGIGADFKQAFGSSTVAGIHGEMEQRVALEVAQVRIRPTTFWSMTGMNWSCRNSMPYRK
jgi:hypothetical protein